MLGKKKIASMTGSASAIEDNKIIDIENIVLAFEISDEEDWFADPMYEASFTIVP